MEWDPCLSPPSLRPHFLVLLCACMSGGALLQIRRCNSCSSCLCAPCTHPNTCTQTHMDSHSSRKASTKHSRRPLMRAITQSCPDHMSHQTQPTAPQHRLSHYAELSPCYQTRHTRAQAHLQPEYFWVTGLFGSTPINSSQHSISVG